MEDAVSKEGKMCETCWMDDERGLGRIIPISLGGACRVDDACVSKSLGFIVPPDHHSCFSLELPNLCIVNFTSTGKVRNNRLD